MFNTITDPSFSHSTCLYHLPVVNLTPRLLLLSLVSDSSLDSPTTGISVPCVSTRISSDPSPRWTPLPVSSLIVVRSHGPSVTGTFVTTLYRGLVRPGTSYATVQIRNSRHPWHHQSSFVQSFWTIYNRKMSLKSLNIECMLFYVCEVYK